MSPPSLVLRSDAHARSPRAEASATRLRAGAACPGWRVFHCTITGVSRSWPSTEIAAGSIVRCAPPPGGKPHQRAPRMRSRWAWANSTTVPSCRGEPVEDPVGAVADVVERLAGADRGASRSTSPGRRRAGRRCACRRTRRSPTRRGRRPPSAWSPSPASSHVRRARCSGLVQHAGALDVASAARIGREQPGARLTLGVERDVGASGVQAARAPVGLAVSDEDHPVGHGRGR